MKNIVVEVKKITMNIINTAIDGVVIIEPRLFRDARGYFFESWNQNEFNEKVRAIEFCQAMRVCLLME